MITDALAGREEYSFTSFGLEDHPDPDVESVVADVRDYEEIRPHFDGMGAVVHLAYSPEDRRTG